MRAAAGIIAFMAILVIGIILIINESVKRRQNNSE